MKLNFTRKVRQIAPAGCNKKMTWDAFDALSDEELTDRVFVEEKNDGNRYLLHIGVRGNNVLTSRRVSTVTKRYVEKQNKVPFVRDYAFNPVIGDTVLDGEFMSDGISTDTQHEMAHGRGRYVCWDILFCRGVDVRDQQQWKRKILLRDIQDYFPPWLTVVRSAMGPKGIKALSLALREAKKEGLVVKDKNAPYGDGWTKVKGSDNHDCVIFDYDWNSTGKYAVNGWIKSIRIAQFWPHMTKHPTLKVAPGLVAPRTGSFVDVGKASSGLSEAQRGEISANPKKFIGRCVEVASPLRLKSGRLRHPTFVRFRDDKNQTDCVLA